MVSSDWFKYFSNAFSLVNLILSLPQNTSNFTKRTLLKILMKEGIERKSDKGDDRGKRMIKEGIEGK